VRTKKLFTTTHIERGVITNKDKKDKWTKMRNDLSFKASFDLKCQGVGARDFRKRCKGCE